MVHGTMNRKCRLRETAQIFICPAHIDISRLVLRTALSVALSVTVALALGAMLGWLSQPYTVFGATTVTVINRSRGVMEGLRFSSGDVNVAVPKLAASVAYTFKLPSGQIGLARPLVLTDTVTGARHVIELDAANELGSGEIDIVVVGRTARGLSGQEVVRCGSIAPPFPYRWTTPIRAIGEVR